MKDMLQRQTEKYTKEQKKRRRWQKVLTGLAAVAVFCTTYALILPAITWEKSLICDLPEHHHDDSCYEVAVEPAETELVCHTAEHEHGAECYEERLVCGMEESEEHVHSDACYSSELVCTAGEHTHTDACYQTVGEAHEIKVLTCQIAEHEHTAACFDAPPAEACEYHCGQSEHVHSDKCYYSDGTLKCTIPEHTHTESCGTGSFTDEDSSQQEEIAEAGTVAEEVLVEEITEIDPGTGKAAIEEIPVEEIKKEEGTNEEIPAEKIATEEIPKEERTIVSEPASDGAVAVITGCLPAEAAAGIEMVQLSEEQLIEYFGEEKAKRMNVYATYDITILVNGEEWQPDASVSVTIRKPVSDDMGIGQTAVEHIDSVTGEAERMETSAGDDGEISFVTDGFSLYVFYTFTVDYYFEDAEYHQPGLSSMYLSELLAELGIEHSISEVEEVTFSDSSLLNVSKEESGDWLLSSLEAFSSDELLTLILKDGEEIRIDTKDVVPYTWFNVHNRVTGGNPGDAYYFTFDYIDENGNHQQYDRWLVDYEQIEALKVALNTPVTITQVHGKYKDAGGTIHTDGVYDNYLQLGGDPQVKTNVFHVDSINTLYQNVNVCFYEISSSGLGILNITKNAVNSSDPNQKYHFVVLYHATNYKMSAAEFDLKSGETKNILYYCDYQYKNNMEIFVAETTTFSNCDVSYTVNGSTVSPQQYDLGRVYWENGSENNRIHEDLGKKYDGYNYIMIPINKNLDTFNVVCNNTFVDRSVTIRKTAVQGEPDKNFTFTIKAYNASNAEVWTGNASVKSGNYKKVDIPVDCSYVIVKETNHTGYTVSMSGSGTNSGTDARRIPKAQFPADVTFTNTREVAKITLTKKLVNDDMTVPESFHFEAEVTDKDGNPIDVSTITQPADSGVTLKPGTKNVLQVDISFDITNSSGEEKSVQINVPKGAKVTFKEKDPGADYDVNNTRGTGRTGTMNGVKTGDEIKYTNTKKPSTVNLTVIKDLRGLQNGEFEFEMSVDSTSWPPSPLPAGWPDEAVIGTDGVIRFTLTVTEGSKPQITIPGIPVGSEVTITETTHDGFKVKFTDDAIAYTHAGYTDTYTVTADKTVTVVNTAGTELPSTGGIGVYPIYALGLLLIAGSMMYGYILWRRRERGIE